MPAHWRTIARTVAATALITTTFWFVVAAWFLRHTGEPRRAPSPQAPAKDEAADRAKPVAPGSGGSLAIPVVGVRADQLVDTFTQARAAGARRHDAIDIMAPQGTTVIAAAPGRVEKLFLSDEGGKTVYVRSADRRRIYYYAHLDRYAGSLREGRSIRRGEPIGTVGSTGNANAEAPHLHFAIWRTAPDAEWYEEADAINPYGLLTGR